MSMGRGGFARRIYEDKVSVVYEYSGYDYNVPETVCREPRLNGRITVYKTPPDSPDGSGGEETLVRKEGRVFGVVNAGFCTALRGGADVAALRLADKIFSAAEEKGVFPETMSYHT